MRVAAEKVTPLATQHWMAKGVEKTNFSNSTLITCPSRRIVVSLLLDPKSPYKHCLVGWSVVCPAGGATRKARAHALIVFAEFLFVQHVIQVGFFYYYLISNTWQFK